jgi:hypothetical protein
MLFNTQYTYNQVRKMSAIKQLTIHSVESEYTAEYIANILWRQNIAQVRNITLIPHLKGSSVLQTAYVDVETWCDSEIAYNFISKLNSGLKEARLVHNSDNWWKVEINRYNTSHLQAYAYTHHFPESYFNKDKNELQKLVDAFIDNAVNNSQHVTLRPHQQIYKQQKSFMV